MTASSSGHELSLNYQLGRHLYVKRTLAAPRKFSWQRLTSHTLPVFTTQFRLSPITNPHSPFMSFLPDEDDALAFEAALSFLDECSADSSPSNSYSSARPLTDNAKPRPSVFRAAPTFSIACQEGSTMVPIYTKLQCNAASSSGSQLNLTPSRKTQAHQKLTRAKKAPANPNRVRDEAQYELAFLREKVAEMEQQLRNLHLNTPSSNAAALVSVPRSLPPVPRVWQDMASRQRRRRDDALRENVRLRLIVERKRKMATGLSALLRKRLTQQGAECSRANNSSAAGHATCVLDFEGDIGDFQDLFHHLQIAHHEVDAVFAARGLATMETRTSNVHVREGADGKYIEVFANKLLPFSLHDTGEAAWNHFKGVEKHFGNGGLYEKAAKNLDQPYTIIEDFTKEMFSNDSRADIKAKQIVQRCVGADRDMILFVSSVAPIEIKHKPIDGLVYHAREYALTKPFPDSTLEHEVSLLQLYVRVSFDYEPGVVYDSRHVRSVAQFVIGNVAGSLRCYQERIENALVDQALKQQ